jgi:hypothetical protein
MSEKNNHSILPMVREETLPVVENRKEISPNILTIEKAERKSIFEHLDSIIQIAMKMTQEELGSMANRIMTMAAHIGVMADRIGEMANRIVHTEHLIVNTAVLVVDFGLIMDATIRNTTHSFLYALSIIFKRDFTPPVQSQKHLDVISDNVKQILTQQHEFSLRMLDNQKEMRDSTMKTFDKGFQ